MENLCVTASNKSELVLDCANPAFSGEVDRYVSSSDVLPSNIYPEIRVSECSNSESEFSDGNSEETASIPSSPALPPPTVPFSMTVDNVNVGEGGIYTLDGNQFIFNVIQKITVPEDEKVSSKIIDNLKSNAIKINKETCKQFVHNGSSNFQLPCGKKALGAANKKLCCWLLGLIAFITVLYLVISAVIVSLISTHQSSLENTSQTNTQQPSFTPIEGSNVTGAPSFVERAEWVAQPPTCSLDNNTLPVDGVVVTHTASDPCDTLPDCVAKVRYIQMFHVESRKWCDISYNFLVGGDGRVYVGRGWNYIGSHTIGYDNNTLGVAFIGTYIEKLPNDNQLQAFKDLLTLGVELGKISASYSLMVHCQLKSTQSPGWMLVQLLTTWPHFNTELHPSCTRQ